LKTKEPPGVPLAALRFVKSSADRSVDGGVAAIFVIPKNLGVAGDSAMADDPTFAARRPYQRRMMQDGMLRIRAG
jgi:hypothetical protein